DLWRSGGPQETPEEFEALTANFAQAVDPLTCNEKWKLAAVYAGKYGGAHRQPWEQLVNLIREVHREAAAAQESLVKYGPQPPDTEDMEEQQRIAGEILGHLEEGGETQLFHAAYPQSMEPIH